MITDLGEIRKLSQLKKEENLQFSLHIKQFSSAEIDKIVFKLNENISSKIDCTACANCCKILHPAVSEKEANCLSEIKKEDQTNFKTNHLDYDELQKVYHFKQPPCIFLVDRKCGVYDLRPASCAEYPHLNKPNFKYRLRSIFTNYQICPIVFNVVESLKRKIMDSNI